MMSITINWNGGGMIIAPSTKILAAILAIFAIGVTCIGLACFALIAGAGYLVCMLAMLLLHALTVAIYGSLFSFGFSIFLCAGLLILFVLLAIRVFRPCKGGNGGVV